MSDVFHIGQGATLPLLQATLLGTDGKPVDLAGCTIAFRMRDATRTFLAIVPAGVASIVGDPTDGVVQYAWGAADTVLAGSYDAEWSVTFAGGAVMTFPAAVYNRIEIKPALT